MDQMKLIEVTKIDSYFAVKLTLPDGKTRYHEPKYSAREPKDCRWTMAQVEENIKNFDSWKNVTAEIVEVAAHE